MSKPTVFNYNEYVRMEDERDRLQGENQELQEKIAQLQIRCRIAEEDLRQSQNDLLKMGTSRKTPEEMIDTMTEEIDGLKEKLAKANDKAKKVKEDLKKEKDGRQAAIDQAIGNQRQAMEQEIRKEVEGELVDARKHIGELTGQIDQLEKRAANAGDEKKVQFKLLMDQLQQTFRRALEVVSQQADQEMQEKMNNALRIVVKSFEEAL